MPNQNTYVRPADISEFAQHFCTSHDDDEQDIINAADLMESELCLIQFAINRRAQANVRSADISQEAL